MKTGTDKNPHLRIWTANELPNNGLELFGYCRYVKAEQPLDWHTHENCLEFICLLNGEETYFLGETKYSMHGGDVFVSTPGQKHSGDGLHHGIGEYIWFQINPYAIGELLGLSSENSIILREILLHWDTPLFKVSPEAMRLAKRVYCALDENRGKLLFTGLFIELLSLLFYDRHTNYGADDQIQEAIHYILLHLESDLSIKAISNVVGMSESGFKHKFRKQTGYTPGDYINRNRIMCAMELLKSGCQVTQAAIRTGFNSSDYFAKVFKKYTRQTPTDFIKSFHFDKKVQAGCNL